MGSGRWAQKSLPAGWKGEWKGYPSLPLFLWLRLFSFLHSPLLPYPPPWFILHPLPFLSLAHSHSFYHIYSQSLGPVWFCLFTSTTPDTLPQSNASLWWKGGEQHWGCQPQVWIRIHWPMVLVQLSCLKAHHMVPHVLDSICGGGLAWAECSLEVFIEAVPEVHMLSCTLQCLAGQ